MPEDLTIKFRVETEDAQKNVEELREELNRTKAGADEATRSAAKVGRSMADSTKEFASISKDLGTISPTIGRITKDVTALTAAVKKLGVARRTAAGKGADVTDMGQTIGGTKRQGIASRASIGKIAGVAGIAAIGTSLFNAITGSGSKLAGFDKLNTVGTPDVLDSIRERLGKSTDQIAELSTAVLSATAVMKALEQTERYAIQTPEPIAVPIFYDEKDIEDLKQTLPVKWDIPVSVPDASVAELETLIDNLAVQIQHAGESFSIPIPEEFVTHIDFDVGEFQIDIPSEYVIKFLADARGLDVTLDKVESRVEDIRVQTASWFSTVPSTVLDSFDRLVADAGQIGSVLSAGVLGAASKANALFDEAAKEADTIGKTVGAWFTGAKAKVGVIFTDALADAVRIGDEIGTWFTGAKAKVGVIFTDALTYSGQMATSISKWFFGVAASAGKIFDEAKAEAAEVGEGIGSWFTGIKVKAGAIFDEAVAEAGKVGSTVGAWFTGAMQRASGIFDEALSESKRIGDSIAAWFTGAKAKAAVVFDEAVAEASKIGDAVGRWFDNAATKADKVFDGAAAKAKAIGDSIAAWFDKALASTEGWFEGMLDDAVRIGNEIGTWFDKNMLNTAKTYWQSIASWVGAIGAEIASWSSGVSQGVNANTPTATTTTDIGKLIEQIPATSGYQKVLSAAKGMSQNQAMAYIARSVEGGTITKTEGDAIVQALNGPGIEYPTTTPSGASLLDSIGQTWNEDMQALADIGNSINDAIASLLGQGNIGKYDSTSAETSLAVLAALIPATQMGEAVALLNSGKTVEQIVTVLRGASAVPGFAEGGVFEPNKPMLGIFGDNTREVEVASPYSTIVQAVRDAMASLISGSVSDALGASRTPSDGSIGGSRGPIQVNLTLNGKTVARAIYDDLENERTRRGSMIA